MGEGRQGRKVKALEGGTQGIQKEVAKEAGPHIDRGRRREERNFTPPIIFHLHSTLVPPEINTSLFSYFTVDFTNI